MILNRITEAVRKQNWLAVAIEFVIVVTGVLLAFQITAWGAERQARIEERNALVLLQEEAEDVVIYWRRAVLEALDRDARRITFVAALSSGHIEPEDVPVIDDAIQRMFHYPSVFPPRNAYDALMASGGLAAISDGEARSAVSAYATWLEFIDGQLAQFRLSLPMQADLRAGRVLSIYDPDSRQLRRFSYDFAALAADPVFVSGMVEGARNQRTFQRYGVDALRLAIAMCISVSAALDMVCDDVQGARTVLATARERLE